MIDRVIKMFKQVIYYFIAVVEQGSFSKAAKNLYLTQPALSIAVKKEEKELETYRSDRSGGMCLCDSWSDSWNQADQQRKQHNIRCSNNCISSRSDRDNPDTYNSERL